MGAVDLTDAGYGSGFSLIQPLHQSGVFRDGFQHEQNLIHRNSFPESLFAGNRLHVTKRKVEQVPLSVFFHYEFMGGSR